MANGLVLDELGLGLDELGVGLELLQELDFVFFGGVELVEVSLEGFDDDFDFFVALEDVLDRQIIPQILLKIRKLLLIIQLILLNPLNQLLQIMQNHHPIQWVDLLNYIRVPILDLPQNIKQKAKLRLLDQAV